MRRLISAWVIAKSRQYNSDHTWVPMVRAELHALAPLVRGKPLGLAIIAEALDATTDDCSADDFNTMIKGSTDPAADGYVIATTSTCTGNLSRAAVAGGDRSIPALIRTAEYGGLPPRDALPLYAYLTSPAALAHVREGDRLWVSAILWQRYLRALFDADFEARALSDFDLLPVDLRALIVSPEIPAKRVAVVDGIAMTFEVENNSEGATESADALDEQLAPIAIGAAATAATIPVQRAKPKPRDLSSINAPILQLAEAMATAGRADEARRLIATLPGLAERRRRSYASSTGREPQRPPAWKPTICRWVHFHSTIS